MGISIGHLLVVLLIVVLLFGTRRLASMGRDLGSALKGFRDAVREPREEPAEKASAERRESERVIEGKVETKDRERT
jgi:sec-independent protein translocase protein TatA